MSPHLALNPNTALFVLVHGFKTGTFTGRRISDYINAGAADFVNARRCINGTDHAHDIAQLAEKYLQGISNMTSEAGVVIEHNRARFPPYRRRRARMRPRPVRMRQVQAKTSPILV